MRVRTIVIDANLFGSGNFSAKVLQNLAPLANAGNHIVVPEPVTWEWAEHAHTLLTEASAAHARAASNVDQSLLQKALIAPDSTVSDFAPMDSKVVSAEALATTIASIIRAAHRNFSVAPVDSWNASDALKRQTLLAGDVYERRQGVKTGAVDALVLAHATRLRKEHGTGQVAILTKDKRLGSAAAAAGVEWKSDLNSLAQWAMQVPDAATVEENALHDFFQRCLLSGDLESETRQPRNDIDLEVDGIGVVSFDGIYVSVSLVDLVSVELDSAVELRTSGDTNYGFVELRISGVAEVTESEQFSDENVVHLDPVVAYVKAMVKLDEDWIPLRIESIGEVFVEASHENTDAGSRLWSLQATPSRGWYE